MQVAVVAELLYYLSCPHRTPDAPFHERSSVGTSKYPRHSRRVSQVIPECTHLKLTLPFPHCEPPQLVGHWQLLCCFPPLAETSAMETSTSRTSEKKDKMDGNGFSDLPKKPSETRGNTPSPEQQLCRNVVSSFVGAGSGGWLSWGLAGAQPEGKEGEPTRTMKYTFQKLRSHLGNRCTLLSSGSIRHQQQPQQSEVTYSSRLSGILSRAGS